MFGQNTQLEVITSALATPSKREAQLQAGVMKGKRFHYFGLVLSRVTIRYERMKRLVDRIEVFAAIILCIVFLGIFVWQVFTSGVEALLFTQHFWTGAYVLPAFVWGAVLAACFAYYQFVSNAPHKESIPNDIHDEMRVVSLTEIANGHAGRRFNMADTFTALALHCVEEAFLSADAVNAPRVEAIHVFYALLLDERIAGIFVRLGIPAKQLSGEIKDAFEKGKEDQEPQMSLDAWQIIFNAYELAAASDQEYVHVTELLLATVRQSDTLQQMLFDLGVDGQKLLNVVEWVRIRERLHMQYVQMRKVGGSRNKHGLDRAMTAVSTPFLHQYSENMTSAAAVGALAPCVARKREIDEILRSIESGQHGILLVGYPGVGKLSLVQGIAQRMIEETVPKELRDKQLIALSTSALVAGTTASGAQERILHIVKEMGRAKNIVLFINNIHDIVGSADAGLDVSEAISEFISSGQVLVIATTTPEAYAKYISRTELGSILSKVEVHEMDENQAIQVLEAKAGPLEYKHNIFYAYSAVESAVALATRFMHDQQLPENAISLLREAATVARSARGNNTLVTKDDVAKVASDKSGVPIENIGADETAKLLKLEEEMHKRVIGQDEAVTVVSAALRRARAEIRSTHKPIANFLFVGSTGVGKTELAKTIAEIYFGGENAMVRLDMSEYKDASAIYRLIGQAGQQGTGQLAEKVRQQPFSLVLLDEIEKADPSILDLFLQIFDDGRMTDSTGRVVDFTNTIIIATSNAGTSRVQSEIAKGESHEHIKDMLLKDELKQYFRPEFINRFDGVVVFTPLDRDDIKQIAHNMLMRVVADLEKKGITLEITEEGLEVLAEVGFDPEYGARPMRRAIQDKVENVLADMVLKGELTRRDTVTFGADGLVKS